MKPVPKGWQRFSPSVYYVDANKAIDWLCTAFGFEVRLKVEGDQGEVVHSELTYGGDGVLMIGQRKDDAMTRERTSPVEIEGRYTGGVMVYVDDVDAHHERAILCGAKVTQAPETHDYGEEYWADRSYGCKDLEGHHWWFSQRTRG